MEKIYTLFQANIHEQIQRVRRSPHAGFLGGEVYRSLEDALLAVTRQVTGSTVDGMIAEEASRRGNPFASILPEMVTEEERDLAVRLLEEKRAAGEAVFPAPMEQLLQERLRDFTDAFLEMLERITENRERLRAVLPGQKPFRSVTGVTFSAGDPHRHGRSVMVIRTDAGRMVYKPRDLRMDAQVHDLVAGSFFSECVGIPRCVAFRDRFGVCEYIEKQRPEGEEEARRFFARLGGMAVLVKLLGSTDMHMENVTCRDGKPYLLDLETVLSPIPENETYSIRQPELSVLKARSPYLSGLLPAAPDGRETSILMNTQEDGCAPVVHGERVPVAAFPDAFLQGYETAYRRAAENRGKLAGQVREIPDDLPVRILPRSTQSYADMIAKLTQRSSLSSGAAWEQAGAVLRRVLSRQARPGFEGFTESEARQLLRGDIPWVTAAAGGHALFSDGKRLQENVFAQTAKDHALENLANLGEDDLRFDLRLLDRAIRQYPLKQEGSGNPAEARPRRGEKPLPKEDALREAERLLGEAFALHIPAPDGHLFWGYRYEGDGSFRFCDAGLACGLSGFGTFAAACLSVSRDERVFSMARRIVREALADLCRAMDAVRSRNYAFEEMPQLGESEGLAGMLTGLELIRSYAPQEGTAGLDGRVEELLANLDLERYGAPDRMTGLAGFLSALCRFPGYRKRKDLIRRAADRLLALKTLAFRDNLLWKTLPDTPRPVCGAGHGHAGIAEALLAAARVLGSAEYAAAAAEALDFENAMYDLYHERFGTWADLRTNPPTGIMHGYCSGAPGTGILLSRVRPSGSFGPSGAGIEAAVETLLRRVRTSLDRLPLNERDYLCCGNSAVAEAYLSMGDPDAAGRVLAGMLSRRSTEGEYRYLGKPYRNSVTPSLFYGISGIGYEMLRYAFPDRIFSVL